MDLYGLPLFYLPVALDSITHHETIKPSQNERAFSFGLISALVFRKPTF
jgi:hypothetical protein